MVQPPGGKGKYSALHLRLSTVRLGGIDYHDGGQEAIAAAGDRSNEVRRSRRIAKHLTQRANDYAYHSIAHSRLRPDGIQELVFGHQAVPMGHQV